MATIRRAVLSLAMIVSMAAMCAGEPVVKGESTDAEVAKREQRFCRLVAGLQAESPAIRAEAAFTLGTLGDRRAVPHLIKTLGDATAHVRAMAILSLGQLGDRSAVDAILPALADTHVNSREKAIAALGLLGGRKAIDGLMPLLDNDDPDIRGQAAIALGTTRSKRCIKPLAGALTDPNSSVRASACKGLGYFNERSIIAPLEKRIEDEQQVVRTAALEALMREPLLVLAWRPGDIEPWLARIKHTRPEVRLYAVVSARFGGDPRAVERLIAVLSDENIVVSTEAANSLGKLGGEKAAQALLKVLAEAKTYQGWVAAAAALAELRDRRAIPLLLQKLNAGPINGWGVYEPALIALGMLGDENTLKELRIFRDENRNSVFVMPTLIGALARLGDSDSWRILRDAAKAEGEEQRVLAVRWLAYTESPQAAEPLAWLLKDPNANIRAYAARGLGGIKPRSEEAVKALRAARKDKDANVRRTVTAVLEQLSKEESAPQ